MAIEQGDINLILAAISPVIQQQIDKRIEDAFNAHVQGTLTPIVQELAQRDELIENNLVGRVLAEGWQGLSNEAWKRYVLHEAERIMEQEEEERLEEFLDSETVEEVKRVVEENDPAPVVKKIKKVDEDE